MAKSLVAALALFASLATPTFASEDALPDEVHLVADEYGLDPVDLWAAMHSTNIWNPRDYLCGVGEGPCSGQFTVAAAPVRGRSIVALVTWYAPTGNRMRNGEWPYPGAAACGSNIGLGSTVVFDTGDRYFCADTGYLAANQVDVFGDPSAPRRLSGHSLRILS